ncbi:MAG: hypothetical protein M1828_005124, partial [Chrysothrix sp. TS-e1954]
MSESSRYFNVSTDGPPTGSTPESSSHARVRNTEQSQLLASTAVSDDNSSNVSLKAPKSFPERISPRAEHTKARSLASWKYDGIAWLIACGFFLAVIGLLSYWDDKPFNSWTFGISLNAMISVLASLTYLFLLVPVSSSIAQLKWNHFSQPRPLYDFSLIDQASKSTFG